jgi:hypothetical protein
MIRDEIEKNTKRRIKKTKKNRIRKIRTKFDIKII